MSARRILVIDDDPYVHQILKLCLEALGEFTIHYAPDGWRGVRLAATCRPELILLDYDLPGPDGLETLHKLRTSLPGLEAPIIAITGALRLTPRCQEMIRGCDGHLAKPFQLAQLRHVVLDRLAASAANPGAGPFPATGPA